MSRGHLLQIAERAIEQLPPERLEAIVGDFMSVPYLPEGQSGEVALIAEVRAFCEASLRGEFFESFAVNSKNDRELSKGTEAFIAEMDRLMERCQGVAAEGSKTEAREAFEHLFTLLRQIDEEPDCIVFFADEGGAWQIPVDWGMVLPVYFQCLAEGTFAETFAKTVDEAIEAFCNYRRPELLSAAQRVASPEQRSALQRRQTTPVGR